MHTSLQLTFFYSMCFSEALPIVIHTRLVGSNSISTNKSV